jgi:ubiquinone/menaquinone biosynthesis C-methylase UbiE
MLGSTIFEIRFIQGESMHNHHHGQRFQHVERLRSPERVQRLEVERVVQLALEGASIKSVLDIGTGTGLFAEAFTKQGLNVTGIDPNPEMLEEARSHLPGADFRQATAEAIPFPDGTYGLVFMGLALHETDDLLKAMQESSRVAQARLVILEWPYSQQDFGPGLDERLEPAQVLNFAAQAGLSAGETIPLEHLLLYRFDKADHSLR